ncbi:YkgJ family cysteine cluster protein [Flavobacteriaceae bacterium]|nr:YkgJ family cysteine cluster protein [Flavobacteriaceae bacterium]MDB9874261.1 YkgJ family cysteine cluster protein [Flavobacteriaceae bacterium]MDC1265613.1 YkgJ family cysteine cluster protein [Flavobacteriaceae bacterium]
MQDQLQSLPKKVQENKKAHRNFFIKLRKKTPKNLDAIMEKLHDEEFKKSDCLQCANCCKTTSPIFTKKDIERISKSFRIKTRQFIDTYLNVDDDQDYVLKSSPCTFLAEDNTCNIYDVRPKACQEYPHTNRKSFEKISDLTLQNVAICPATFNIVEALRAKLK